MRKTIDNKVTEDITSIALRNYARGMDAGALLVVVAGVGVGLVLSIALYSKSDDLTYDPTNKIIYTTTGCSGLPISGRIDELQFFKDKGCYELKKK